MRPPSALARPPPPQTASLRTSTALGTNQNTSHNAIREGKFTEHIYAMIRDARFADAIQTLHTKLLEFPNSRPAASLLAYCYYHTGAFAEALRTYERLMRLCPDVDQYKLYYAQSLFKAGLYEPAMKACQNVGDSAELQQRVLMLQAAIKYELDELLETKALIDQCPADEADTLVNQACVLYKEATQSDSPAEMLDAARAKFSEAMNATGYQAEIVYAIALCFYQQKDYGAALRHVATIIERGVREHPELSVGSQTEGVDVRSVGNSTVLKETALVEAFNLKAAIEYQLKNHDGAVEALADMPPRADEELDPVSLHNTALMRIESEPAAGFRKLNFLLSNPPFPPETFANLLLLYCKHHYYDLAADVLADNAALTYKFLSPELYAFLDASLGVNTAPEEAYRKFDDLSRMHVENLRGLTKHIQDARLAHDNAAIKEALGTYDEALERYIPVLMAQAKIYWDRENFPQVEKIFRQSAEFCSEHELWKLNVAHVFFLQEAKFADAIKYYEPIVKRAGAALLDVPAIVLANLCVSYIMTSQNEEAEELMRQVEHEEEAAVADKPILHLCIINLVIGTLYCAKGNYEFGVGRVMRSLEPYHMKLSTDTWFYAKRVLLALAEKLAKHMLQLKDSLLHDVLEFLSAVESVGKDVPTKVQTHPDRPVDTLMANVAYEARLLRGVFVRLRNA